MNRATTARRPEPPGDEFDSPPEASAEAQGGDRPSTRRPRLVAAAGLGGIVLASLLLRLEGQATWFWIDEGLSVGIASHRLGEIPRLLVQDGNPPLYYLLLHGWMRLVGSSETQTHALSLLLGLASVPVAFLTVRSLFGRKAGWIAALLAATNPYITFYSRETRMYALVVVLGMVVVWSYLHAFVYRRRRYLVVFSVSLALLLYTHNWSLFLTLGLIVGLAPRLWVAGHRARVLADAAMAFGGALLLYLPWVPSVLAQARLTGAPFARAPHVRHAISAVGLIVGDERALAILLITAGAGLAGAAWRFRDRDGIGAAVLSLLATVTVALGAAWLFSQAKPAWAERYFGMLLAPALVLAAVGLSRAGRLGLVGLLLVLVFWTKPLARVGGLHVGADANDKSNVKLVMKRFSPSLRPGDLVVSAQMEQAPLLRYYLPDGLRYATPMGPVADERVADWRRASIRMREATPEKNLVPLLDELPVGRRVLMVCPRISTHRKDLSWFRSMDDRCREWRLTLASDTRFEWSSGPYPRIESLQPGTSVFALLFTKMSP